MDLRGMALRAARTCAVALLLLTFPVWSVYANAFRSAQVLEWSERSQDFYFETSIMMAGIVASQNEGGHAECINDWYFGGEANRSQVHASILNALRKFPNYHPGAVVLAVIQKKCGALRFTD